MFHTVQGHQQPWLDKNSALMDCLKKNATPVILFGVFKIDVNIQLTFQSVH